MSITARQLAELMPDATQVESDEPEMESSLHYLQLALLVSCLEWLWRDKNDYFIGANLTIYFNRQQLKNKDFRGPDFFLIKQTEKHPRKSWVTWEEEGKYPDLIIELLSESTADVDKTVKKDLYQNRFRTPEYFWFSPDTLEFAGFRLSQGQYEEISPNESGWLWSESLGLYLGLYQQQLRYFTLEGQLVPTPEEDAQQQIRRAEQAQQRAEQAQQRAEQQQQRAEQLAAQLRELGIEPEA
ncbi:Uma2 family endonuclease [Crocosphaera sp. XPORK-15E]|uniref:Uma2 family endonuclease n=1 Tax=Crocosphaera sp. XPORK-15E TaxID=3110247 RepID=UPI002B21E301|nr:Uma2 family endonuclease [Crocosphaera sp. XPORK-15E]MEA5534517.1 Uma2 family endonuclease [Crocosphaera sp. XPORK-15E]